MLQRVPLDLDAVIRWLTEHLGVRVVAAVQGSGNTALSATGHLLRVDDREITLIDPAPGRVEVFAVGGATLVLLEGDFAQAGTTDFGTGGARLVQAAFGEVVVTVAELPA
jgi:catechol 2,3-dioxygenase-like lactoylglutathione lyase family enzyme